MDETGPVFPSHASLGNLSTGMTLRQWYAGMALIGQCAAQNQNDFGIWNNKNSLAKECFEIADAMIAEGNK